MLVQLGLMISALRMKYVSEQINNSAELFLYIRRLREAIF